MALAILSACAEPRELGGACSDAGDACAARIHAAGVLDPASPTFHGAILRASNWDFARCATCHGDDFSGGAAKVSCIGCHAQGPTACTTCHTLMPASNAHRAHGENAVACDACHVVPARWDDDGHILRNGVALDAAPVTLGARANATLDPADRHGAASYDPATRTCTNVYCHGAVLHAGGGLASSPRWDDPAPGTCARCHGAPPPSHARGDCATCHPANAPHVDGIVQIGRAPGCGGCHGTSDASPAPPVDLAGNTATTALGVGAHDRHLHARIATPIACATCHVVPSTITSVGHLDSAGPAEVNAALGWDRTTATCTTASCHGASRPVWTSHGDVSCGTCHGIPPSDASHQPTMTLATCATCHPRTVDTFGNILFVNGRSAHADGVVDLQ